MSINIFRIKNFLLLTTTLLLLNGCNGGGGGSSSGGAGPIGSITGLGDTPVITLAGGSGDPLGDPSEDPSGNSSDDSSENNSGNTSVENQGTGETIAKIHNPEPATMLLFGSGIMAFAAAKRRKNSK